MATLDTRVTTLEDTIRSINDRLGSLERIEINMKHVRGRIDHIYDALENYGFPLPKAEVAP